jgi:DNA processing protein
MGSARQQELNREAGSRTDRRLDAKEASSGEAPAPPHRVLEGAALPPAIRGLPDPPARLFLYGCLPSSPRVAIVGTRHPSTEASNYAEFIASWLAARGVAILSGGAKGIDAAAHVGALQTGVTVVVAPSSFDRPFPLTHRSMYAEIVERGGGYLSLFDHDVPARREYFLARNRVLVALGDAVIVVEAPSRSGARNAGKWARRLGRPYFVVPSPPWNERGRGCILELQLGGRALGAPEEVLRALERAARRLPCAPKPASPRTALATRPGADPAATHLDPSPSREAAPRASRSELGAEASRSELRAEAARLDDGSLAERILAALRAGARYAGELASAIGASLPEVQHEVLLLTLSGDVEQGPAGVLTVTRR